MTDLIENEIARLAQQALVNADVMQEAIILGQDVLASEDDAHWDIGDLACIVQKRYGHNAIKMFADGIHANPGTVRERRTVCLRFTKDVRAEIRRELPDLTYSDYRAAARIIKEPGNAEQIQCAKSLLRAIIDEEWTVEKAKVEVSKLIGKEVPPKALLKTEGTLCSIAHDGQQLVFEVPRGLSGSLRQGMDVYLIVREVVL